jgi:type IX secretion system PorP/SprF family membrane protein
MIKKILSILFLLITVGSFAQQDPQYSQYMFNQLVINPAYAGSKDAVSAVIDMRKQWVSMPGAPQTATLSVNGPLQIASIGLGGHMIYQSVGPATWMAAYADYSYKIKIKNGKLAIGLSTGAVNYTFKTSEMEYKNSGEVLTDQYPGSRTTFDVNAGLYYSSRTFFMGASATHITSPKLYNETYSSASGKTSSLIFNLQPHVFLYAGKAFELNENIVVSPSILFKAAQASISKPAIDINCNFLIKRKLWLGVSGKIGYGFAVLLQYYINDNFKIGYCYDMGINKIGTNGKSSHEIVLSYDFRIKKAKSLSPRYLFL